MRNQGLNVVRNGEREVAVEYDALDALASSEALRRVSQMTDAVDLHNDLGRPHDCLAHIDAAKR